MITESNEIYLGSNILRLYGISMLLSILIDSSKSTNLENCTTDKIWFDTYLDMEMIVNLKYTFFHHIIHKIKCAFTYIYIWPHLHEVTAVQVLRQEELSGILIIIFLILPNLIPWNLKNRFIWLRKS